MFNIATMGTVNPILILAAMLANALVWLLRGVVRAVERAAVGLAVLVTFVATHGRLLAMCAGLVAAVVLVAVFWQVVLVGAGVLGGMYAGLLLVVRV